MNENVIQKKFFAGYFLAHIIGYDKSDNKFSDFFHSVVPQIHAVKQKHEKRLRILLHNAHIHPDYAWAIADWVVGAIPTPKPMLPLVDFGRALMSDPIVKEVQKKHDITVRPWMQNFTKTLIRTRKHLQRARISLPQKESILFIPMLLESRQRARMLKMREKFLIVVSAKSISRYPEYQTRHELFHIALAKKNEKGHTKPFPMNNPPRGYFGIWPRSLAREYVIRALQYYFDKTDHPRLAEKNRKYYIETGFVHFDLVHDWIVEYLKTKSITISTLVDRLRRTLQHDNS